MSNGFKAFAVASAAALLLMAGTGPAHARSVNVAAMISCVDKIAGKNAAITPWATVQNNCAFTYKVKVVWNNGADSPCQTLSVREQYTDTSTPGATYDGVRIC
ncbi:hypothetical protein GUY59_07510 [Nonomuraea sp. K271]|nr:hypothetical protein [Nonomuraea sp. K271]